MNLSTHGVPTLPRPARPRSLRVLPLSEAQPPTACKSTLAERTPTRHDQQAVRSHGEPLREVSAHPSAGVTSGRTPALLPAFLFPDALQPDLRRRAERPAVLGLIIHAIPLLRNFQYSLVHPSSSTECHRA